MAKKRKQIDWEAIEREYRAGSLTIREIARQNGCSHPTIMNRAKKEGWDRDLSGKIRQKVTSKITTKITTPGASEKEIIEAASDRIIEVVELHRKDISSQREIAGELMKELRENGENLSTKERADILQKISQASSKYIPLEREAYNIDERGKIEGQIEIAWQEK